MKKTETVPVIGMHCSSCAAMVGKALKKAPGVETVQASYGTEKATITYDDSIATPEALNNSLKKYGYSLAFPASVVDTGKAETHMHHQVADDKALFVFPLALFIFFVMLWENLSSLFPAQVPPVPLPMPLWTGIQFVLASVVLLGFGQQFLQGVIRLITVGKANMDTLVGLGTGAAYLYSSFIYLFPVAVRRLGLSNVLYFDVTIVVIGFILFGKYLESRSKRKTGEALEKLIGLSAKTALVKRNGQELEVDISDVRVGDLVIVKPGTKIPVDGVITEGATAIDESMITGEPMPVDVAEGDNVIGGTMNTNGYIVLRATQIGADTMLSRISKMVEDAQGSKAPIERLTDLISSYFVPAVILISVMTFIGWLVLGSGFFPYPQAFPFALSAAIGVLVIACPCALGLATPTAVITAVGRGARSGILIKDAESLEKLERVNTIVMDKTGTLTKGKPEVVGKYTVDSVPMKDILRTVSALENQSEHPLAKAVLEYAKKEHVSVDGLKVRNFRMIQGKGVIGDLDGKSYVAGNRTMMKELSIDVSAVPLSVHVEKGQTPIFIARDTTLLGALFIADTLKENVQQSIRQLKNAGIDIVMLTGDDERTARYVAKEAGIDTVIAGVLPEEKGKYVEDLKRSGKFVAMVGDGVNDAPALAYADVGIAMSTGTDAAISTANMTLLHGDINKVYTAIILARKTMRIVRENLFWAFIYNVVGIPLAAGALYPVWGIVLNPLYAGMAMALSSVSVVTNSLRLRKTII